MISKKKAYSIESCRNELQIAECLTTGTVNCMELLEKIESGSHFLEQYQLHRSKKKNEKERKILFPSIRCNEELHLTKKS